MIQTLGISIERRESASQFHVSVDKGIERWNLIFYADTRGILERFVVKIFVVRRQCEWSDARTLCVLVQTFSYFYANLCSNQCYAQKYFNPNSIRLAFSIPYMVLTTLKQLGASNQTAHSLKWKINYSSCINSDENEQFQTNLFHSS